MKVTVPIICYGGTVHAHYMQGMLGLVNQCVAKGINADYPLIYFESLISRARNASAAAALYNKSDYLFFIDTDVVFDPKDFFKLLSKLEEFICLHIDKQIEAGANVVQLFDSWAGLLSKDELPNYCYIPTLKIVNHIKQRGVPIICFPKGIKKEDYADFCSIVKPSAISIDCKIDPEWIKNKVNNLPIQGGLDPKILLTNRKNVKKNVDYYLNVFSGYPYIFNLGHGVLPETNPSMIEFIVQTIREKNI